MGPPPRSRPAPAFPSSAAALWGAPRRPLAALAIALGASLWLGGGSAAAAQIQLESPAFSFDAERNRYRYEGARVEFSGLIVEADLVEIDPDAAQIVATGSVRFQDGMVTGSAERLELETLGGVATLYHAEIYEADSGYFLRGEKLVRTAPDRYEGTDCQLTNCRPGEGGWHISAGTIDYQTNSYSLAYNSTLWLGGAPVLWTPVLGWPTVNERRSGFLAPAVSSTSSTKTRFDLDTSLRVPYFLALGFDHDLTITPEYFAQRGTALNLEYNYAFAEGQRGQLRLFRIAENQHRDLRGENVLEGINIEEEDRAPTRYWARFGHNQEFGQRTQLTGRIAEASDGQVLREYEAVREYRPAFEYQTSLSHQGVWGHGAATAAHASEYKQESLFANRSADTDGDTRPQLLPRLSYNGGLQTVPAVPIGVELAGSVTRFITEAGLSGRAESATPAISFPLRLFGSAELRPTVERQFVRYGALEVADSVFLVPPEERQTWLADAEALATEQSFAQTGLQLELRMPFSRRFASESGRWEALKHRVTPRLIYRALEDVRQPLQGLLIAPQPALKLVTLAVDNEMIGLPQGSRSLVGSSIARVNLIQRYNLLLEDEQFTPVGPPLPTPGETEPGEPLLPLIVEAALSAGGVGITSSIHYHHQLDRIVEYRIGLSGSVSTQGSFGISYTENQFTYRTPENLLIGAGNSLGFNGQVLNGDTVTFAFAATANLSELPAPLNRRLSSAQVVVDYHPNCYGIQLAYIEQVDVTSEYNSTTGKNEDSFFIDRRIVLTFNLGGVISSSQDILLNPQQ